MDFNDIFLKQILCFFLCWAYFFLFVFRRRRDTAAPTASKRIGPCTKSRAASARGPTSWNDRLSVNVPSLPLSPPLLLSRFNCLFVFFFCSLNPTSALFLRSGSPAASTTKEKKGAGGRGDHLYIRSSPPRPPDRHDEKKISEPNDHNRASTSAQQTLYCWQDPRVWITEFRMRGKQKRGAYS